MFYPIDRQEKEKSPPHLLPKICLLNCRCPSKYDFRVSLETHIIKRHFVSVFMFRELQHPSVIRRRLPNWAVIDAPNDTKMGYVGHQLMNVAPNLEMWLWVGKTLIW